MTTARETIAGALAAAFGAPGEVDGYDRNIADGILSAILSAPESVRLELAGKLNPWRPIETAPKDGRPLLLHNRGESDDWIGTLKYKYNPYFAPTHWLPLPSPPSEDQVK